MNNKKALLIYLLYSIIIAIAVLSFNLGYSASVLLYFGVPSLYLSIKYPKVIKKTLFYSIWFSVPSVLVFSYIAHVSDVWYVSSELGIRFLGGNIPVEDFLWGFLFFYIIIVMYNALFAERYSKKIIVTNTKYLVTVALVFLLAFFSVLVFNRDLLIMNNFYILMIIFMMALPSFIILPFFSKAIRPVIYLTLFFLPFCFIYEYSALKTEQWFFGEAYFIGWIQLFDVRFPIEEFLFMVFSIPGSVAVYELFSKDSK